MDIRIDQANNILKAFEVPKTLQQIFDEAKAKIVEATTEADIQKGGEGSKGGKVIGHTSTGKPIYDSFNHEAHKDFDKYEHHEAGTVSAHCGQIVNGQGKIGNLKNPQVEQANSHYRESAKLHGGADKILQEQRDAYKNGTEDKWEARRDAVIAANPKLFSKRR